MPTQPTTFLNSSGVAIGTNQLFYQGASGLTAIASGTSGQVLRSNGTSAPSFGDASLRLSYWVLGATQTITANSAITWPTTATFSNGTSFGTMGANGLFTFSATGYYLVTFNYNTSVAPDGWCRFSGLTYRVLEHTTNLKGTCTELINVTAANQTIDIYESVAGSYYGTVNGNSTSLSITKFA